MFSFKEDKIGISCYEKFTSTSGKYTIFFGEHFNGTEACHDVGALNLQTGELIRRHYINRDEAGNAWEEFKQEMRGAGQGYEEDEHIEVDLVPIRKAIKIQR